MESVWYQGRAGRCDVPLTDIVNAANQENNEVGFVVGAGTQLAMVQRIVPNNKKTVYQQLGDAGVLVFLWVLLWVLSFRSREKVNYLIDGALNVTIETAMASI